MNLGLTVRERSHAIYEAVINNNWDIDLTYGGIEKQALAIIESVTHELAHAVCLGFNRSSPRRLFKTLTTRVAHTLGPMTERRRIWHEIESLAAEVIILKQLNVRCWNATIKAAAARENAKQIVPGVWQAIARGPTQRRAQQTLRLLDALTLIGRE